MTESRLTGPVRIAVDIGGTFTDLEILEERSGRHWAHKVPTTPSDPAAGVQPRSRSYFQSSHQRAPLPPDDDAPAEASSRHEQRLALGTSPRTDSTCMPHPAKVGLPQRLQLTRLHMVVSPWAHL